ncbi:hypothetical protein GCM10027217_46970 [Pseudomaricurvus hydrocarbonicus]
MTIVEIKHTRPCPSQKSWAFDMTRYDKNTGDNHLIYAVSSNNCIDYGANNKSICPSR